MDFLKTLFEAGALTWEQFSEAAKKAGFEVVNAAGGAYVPKADLDAKQQELDTANTTIKGLRETAKAWDGKDPKKLEDDLKDLQTKYDTDTANIRKAAAIDLALTRARARMADCQIGGAPQLAAASELTYFGPRGWGFHLSAGYAGLRYVEPMPLRRTDRVSGQAGLTPEAFEAFTRQERLSDAFTLDASLFKSFYFGRSRLTVALMLHNLTDAADLLYNGYESLRVHRISAGDATLWMPHATRYTYAYPRSFYLTISYRFRCRR